MVVSPKRFPASSIHSHFGMGRARQCGVHDLIDLTDITRILPNEPWYHLGQTTLDAERECRKIGRTKRIALCISPQSPISPCFDEGAVKQLDEIVM